MIIKQFKEKYPYFELVTKQMINLANVYDIETNMQIALQTNNINSTDVSIGTGKATGDAQWEQEFKHVNSLLVGTPITFTNSN